jgi:DNA modification methylase
MPAERGTREVDVFCAFDELVPIENLRPNPRNPNRHPQFQIELLAKVIRAQGWRAPVTVSRRSGLVVRGHCRLAAARLLGLARVPVDFQEYGTEEAELADLVADNRIGELSEPDPSLLADLLARLDLTTLDMDLTGYQASELSRLLSHVDEGSGIVEDEIPDLPKVPVTRPGDLWRLGPHRLLCADSARAENVRRITDGTKAVCLWTDPPYGVGYVGKTSRAMTIANDAAAGLPDLLARAFAAAGEALEPGSPFYIAHPAGALALVFENAVAQAGWHLHETLIWVKDTMVLGHSDYHYRHEPVLYGWTKGAGRSGRGRHDGSRWFGDDAQTSVFEIPRPRRSEQHPTAKPVALVAAMLANSTPRGGVVLDPFLGSGTTLIAAEELSRNCLGLELDPAYCDVVIERWENLTGQGAVRHG